VEVGSFILAYQKCIFADQLNFAGYVGGNCVSVRSILKRRPPSDESDTVTCLHTAGLALVNSILIQCIYRRDGRGYYGSLLLY